MAVLQLERFSCVGGGKRTRTADICRAKADFLVVLGQASLRQSSQLRMSV